MKFGPFWWGSKWFKIRRKEVKSSLDLNKKFENEMFLVPKKSLIFSISAAKVPNSLGLKYLDACKCQSGRVYFAIAFNGQSLNEV